MQMNLLSISESIGNRQVFNSIIIRDEQTSTSSSDSLSIEVDSREDGFNEGRSTFAPGEAVHLLVRKGVHLHYHITRGNSRATYLRWSGDLRAYRYPGLR